MRTAQAVVHEDRPGHHAQVARRAAQVPEGLALELADLPIDDGGQHHGSRQERRGQHDQQRFHAGP
jgi:hypothetical protein